MKLIIQIPCFNEENTLPYTIKDLPKKIKGIDKIEYLIIDDGSTDNTVKVAESLKVDHIVRLEKNMGLANAFMMGINESLKQGADIIVNTDGDNQYYGLDIEKLVKPIINNEAEIVIGNRQTSKVKDFHIIKKILQKIGSFVVRFISKTNVIDAPCGFRAYSREAALHLNVLSEYTYTLETIIDAGIKKNKIVNINIKTNSKLRQSRLFKNTWSYIKKSTFTIFRIYIMNKPVKTLLIPSLLFFLIGLILIILESNIYWFIFSLFLMIIGLQFLLTYIIVDSLLASRKTSNQILYLLKKEIYK